MGVRLNWLAVEGVDKAALLERLDLAECGVVSDEFSSRLACAEFPGGWLVIVAPGMGIDLDKTLPLASAGGLALGCEVEEHLMFSRLRAFRDGRAAWSVTHDPDLDVRGVTVHGEPPPIFEDIHGRLAAEAAADASGDVDHMFEAPVQLGEKLCGYCHDRPVPGGWINLDPSSQPQVTRATPRLPAVLRSELLPQLEASGWSSAGESSHVETGEWTFERVRDQRREHLTLNWAEHGGYPQLEAYFQVWESADVEGPLLARGRTRAVRPSERATGKSLWRWIVELYFGRAPDRQDPMTELLARVREDLAAIETFLATGDADRRLLIRAGSAAPVDARDV